MKKRYHLIILGYYNNSDTTETTQIDCDGMFVSAQCYEFWVGESNKRIAFYPIRNTIITKIESLKEDIK